MANPRRVIASVIVMAGLMGCSGGAAGTAAPPTPSATPSPAPTATSRPTIAPSPMPTGPALTPSPWPTGPTPTPTLIGTAQVQGMAACVTPNPNAQFPALTEQANVTNIPDAVLAYLNHGGDPALIVERLPIQGHAADVRTQVVQAALTGSPSPDILLALTIADDTPARTNGDSTLVAFVCQGQKYAAQALFLHAGAGIASEGLFAGGGARVLGVLDVNGNHTPDVVFGVFNEISLEHAVLDGNYYVAEWNGQKFVSLIDYTDWMGTEKFGIETDAPLAIQDTDGDGVLELVFDHAQDPATGDLASPAVFAWDGTTYQLKTP